jgi:hypothetical protein
MWQGKAKTEANPSDQWSKEIPNLSDSSNAWRNTWREKESPVNGKTEAKKCSIVVIRRTQLTNQLSQRGVVQNGLRKKAYAPTYLVYL